MLEDWAVIVRKYCGDQANCKRFYNCRCATSDFVQACDPSHVHYQSTVWWCAWKWGKPLDLHRRILKVTRWCVNDFRISAFQRFLKLRAGSCTIDSHHTYNISVILLRIWLYLIDKHVTNVVLLTIHMKHIRLIHNKHKHAHSLHKGTRICKATHKLEKVKTPNHINTYKFKQNIKKKILNHHNCNINIKQLGCKLK